MNKFLRKNHNNNWQVSCILLLFLLVSITPSCYKRPAVVSNQNFASHYQQDNRKPLPSYVIQNLNDSTGRLYFTVNSKDLLYERNTSNNMLTANMLVMYVLHPAGQMKVFSDSGHVVLNDVNESGVEKQLAGSLDFDIPIRGEYFMEVTFRDLNKMTVNYEVIRLENVDRNSAENFLLTEPGSETPKFRNWLGDKEPFRLIYNDPRQKKFTVRYFRQKAGPARPPYSPPVVFPPQEADSTWNMEIDPDDTLLFSQEGWYVINTDGGRKGFLICRFPSGFPFVSTATQLLEPLRYITTKNEYQTLERSKNVKAAVDSFWLTTGGSEQRARELIRAFYGRVEISNRHFSSTCEGWKTDRGMIYLIYGDPQNVYRTQKTETWVYGQDAAGNVLTFVFDRNILSSSSNDFVLQRSQSYSVSWMQAVDYWKQGQVYRAQ